MFSKTQSGQARPPAKRSKADGPEPKKIGFIFTTKITKEKKNKIYNLRALRGVIKLFFATKSAKFTTKGSNILSEIIKNESCQPTITKILTCNSQNDN